MFHRLFTYEMFNEAMFHQLFSISDAVFALVWEGAPTDYTTYTRTGVSYAEDPLGNPVEVAEDVPPYEYVDGIKQYRQYAGTNIVPNSEDPSAWTLTSGTTYNPTTQEFTIPNSGQIQFLIESTTAYQNIDVFHENVIEEISGELLLRLFDGVGVTSTAVSSPCTCEVERTFDATSNSIRSYLFNDEISDIVVKVSKPSTSTEKIPYIPTTGTEVTVNTGTLSLLSDDPDAHLEWQGITDDAVTFDYGLQGIFNGTASGVNLFNGLTCTDFSELDAICTDGIEGEIIITTQGTSFAGLFVTTFQDIGSIYEVEFEAFSSVAQTAGFSSIVNTGEVGINPINPNLTISYQKYKFRVEATSATYKWYVSNIATTITLKNFTNRKVSSTAIGRVIGETYIPHDLSIELPLIKFTTNDFIPLYVEATTGLLKGTDGTNTCQSSSALTPGSTSNWIFTWDGAEFWITLETVLGTEITFAGTFPATGQKVFGLTAETYQTARHLYFDNDLNSGNNEFLSSYLAAFLGGQP